MQDILVLDLIRGVHLLCMVIGMGLSISYDLRSLQRIALPLAEADIEELHRIHQIVSIACIGLWLSGITLIWIRTGFELDAFSPKLWSKIGVVTLLTLNALILSRVMIPALSRYIGVRLVDLPIRQLLPMAICAGVSLSCWVLALTLGSSVILKTAGWDVLLLVLIEGAALCIGGALVVIFGLRIILRRDNPLFAKLPWVRRAGLK